MISETVWTKNRTHTHFKRSHIENCGLSNEIDEDEEPHIRALLVELMKRKRKMQTKMKR